jgi:hypothetical protein
MEQSRAPSEQPHQTIRILAGQNSNGDPVLEAVPAEEVGPGAFRLLGSPGLAQGAAAGDKVAVHDDGSFNVLERGGNLAIQVVGARGFDAESLQQLVDDVGRLGGRLDGGEARLRVFTIPVSAGFAAVESAFNDFVGRTTGTEWYFANVYDPRDGVTPLGWWDI